MAAGWPDESVERKLASDQVSPPSVDVWYEMSAADKIKVLDTSFYAVTGADGTFKIKNVPPGKYPIVGWQPYGQEYRGEVVVPPGATASTTISLVLGKGPKTHLRKDGTPYGRYK